MVASSPDIAVVGALAYDQIATTSASLSGSRAAAGAHPLPLLNCKVDTLTEAFGGCGGNIAYNLAHNGNCTPLLISVTGSADDQKYTAHLDAYGISPAGLLRLENTLCARAIIITDRDGHQFTAFYPGKVPSKDVWLAHLRQLPLHRCPVFVQAPYPPELMIASLRFAATLDHNPLKVCCPGQYADQLKPTQTRELARHADWIIGNAYEIGHLQRASSLTGKWILQTNGANAIEVTKPDGQQLRFAVPAVPLIVDPTGCGDAFLSSIASDLVRRETLASDDHLAAAIATACDHAALCLGFSGGQQHFALENRHNG
ncbi:MAG: carbohydrate kinase family protein [bacterium]